ncbi:MAG TPA: EAL domain-containing protein [Hyphomicrobiaceae bacterium]|nr:EAL domain-containing protein [Hyphomicrobiaceae bacterium]
MNTASISQLRLGLSAQRLDTAGNAFVLLAMAVVALALGLGLHVQFGVAVWLAVVVALSVLMALVLGHVSIERSEKVAKLFQEIARLEGELAGFKRKPGHALADEPRVPERQSHPSAPVALDKRPAAPGCVVQATLTFSAPPARPSTPEPGAAVPAAATPIAVPPPLGWPEIRTEDTAPGPGPGLTGKSDAGAGPNAGGAPTSGLSRTSEAVWADKTSTPGEAAPELAGGFWPLRPLKTACVDRYAAFSALDPTRPLAAPDVAPKNSEAMRAHMDADTPGLADLRNRSRQPSAPLAPRPAAVSDAEVEQIHGVIKKLAEELRAAKCAPAAQPLGAVLASAMTAEAQIASPAHPLETSGQRGREGAGLPAVAAETAAVASAQERLAEIAGAISAARLDVYLEPILGLSDLRARHYEVSVRLRVGTGGSMTSEDFTPVARGTGLLPLIDAIRVSRGAKVAGHLSDRGIAGSLFSQVSGESLASNHFLREFSDTYHQSETIAERLVLSFAQSDVRGFAAPEWATLKELVDLGFRFALEDVSDLDMDFEALTAAGFAFAKFDARVFLEGLPAQGGLIPAADLCRYLAHLGLTLIVGRIDDEAQLAKVLGFGAVFGQGTLFGAPRAVKPEALRRTQGVAA